MDIVTKLRNIADASRREDGTDIPLGEQCREAADEIERLRLIEEAAISLCDEVREHGTHTCWKQLAKALTSSVHP
jgi:hypothetical protein